MNVSQADVTAAEAVGQRLVAETGQVQDCRVQIVNVVTILNSLVAKLVSGSHVDAPLDPSPDEPPGECVGVVVTTAAGALRIRGAAKFPATDDQRLFEQAD